MLRPRDEGDMRRVEDYRRNAKDCRELARRMPADQRKQLQDMAEQWDNLAVERETALATGKKPDA